MHLYIHTFQYKVSNQCDIIYYNCQSDTNNLEYSITNYCAIMPETGTNKTEEKPKCLCYNNNDNEQCICVLSITIICFNKIEYHLLRKLKLFLVPTNFHSLKL